MRRVPCLLDTGIKLLFCGPESFTPDHNYLMGEAPNLKNFFVAAGFNSLGILSGGGVGYVMAHWIVEGRPPMDVWTVNLRRTHAWQDNDRYLQDRIVETLGIGYQDHWPFRQCAHARAASRRACCTTGSPRPARASASRPDGSGRTGMRGPGRRPLTTTVGVGRTGSPTTPEEHRAVRERVGLFEQSSFAKLMVQGRDAVQVLNRIATANVDVAGGALRVHPVSQRGGRHRGRSHRDAARRRIASWW